MQGDTERLEQGALFVGEPVGKRDQTPIRPSHVATECPIAVVPGEAEVGTEVGATGHALFAFEAWDGGIDGDSTTTVRPRTDQRRELVPEDQPLAKGCVSDAALPVPVSVRAAKTGRKHLELDLVLTRLSDRELDVFQCARAGQPDGGGGGWAQLTGRDGQEAEPTAGRTTSTSFSIVSRS